MENSEEMAKMEKISNHDSNLREENDNVNMENSKMSNKDEQKVSL